MIQIIADILATLLFSAFFSGAEIAFVSSNKLVFELEKKKKKFTASILTRFYENPNRFISTMLVGNNIALVVYGLLMARLLKPYLEMYISGDILILLFQSLIAATFILFAGEFIPKALARINPNFFLTILAVPLYVACFILYPVSKIISGIAWLILKLFGMKISNTLYNRSFGREDLDFFIQKTIEESPQNAELDREVLLFQNALEFSNVKVRDCVVPRTEVVALDLTAPLEELLARFIETGLSKILVYRENIDNVIGYIHSSEMFTKPKDWTKKINALPFVPENMSANKLMKSMLEEKKSMAIVVDEFGGTSGVITLEDLVEEIFGEIEDEHDTKLHIAKKVNEDEYVLSGRMEIDKVNEKFKIELPESDEYATVAGFILNYHCNFPKLNELITIDKFDFKIIKMTNTKIELVKLRIKN